MILTQRHFYTPSTPPLGRLRWGKHPCHVGLPLSLSRREVQLTCRDQGGGTICCGWFPLQRLQRRLLSLRWCTVRPGLLTTCWGTGSARACSLGANILETEDRRLACSSIMSMIPEFSVGIQMGRSVSVRFLPTGIFEIIIWRWSTYFGRIIPSKLRRSIFDKPDLGKN